MRRELVAALAGLLLPAACSAPYVANLPAKGTSPVGYTYQGLAATTPSENSGRTLVLVAFSGGGTRAAALAYGVLELLHQTRIQPRQGPARTLLAEVDAISSNSGGSFAAAFYGLHRERMFTRGGDGLTLFERRMLKRDLEGALKRNGLFNFLRIGTRRYNRSDVAAETYDKLIFKGGRYSDLQRQGRPFIVINAHDTSKQSQFVFTQRQFDLLCSDISGYPLSRAVTASSAVHGIFAPIKLRNYRGPKCPPEPSWVGRVLDGAGAAARGLSGHRELYRRADTARWYIRKSRGRKSAAKGPFYVHLADGAAIDNTGIDALLFGLTRAEAGWGLPGALNRGRIRRVVMIVVNATPRQALNTDLRPGGPSLPQMVLSAVNSSIRASTEASIRRAARTMASLRRRHRRAGVRFYGPMVIEFDRIADLRRRDCFNGIKTALSLPADQVDALRRLGRRQLRADAAFRRLVGDLSGQIGAMPPIRGGRAFCKS